METSLSSKAKSGLRKRQQQFLFAFTATFFDSLSLQCVIRICLDRKTAHRVYALQGGFLTQSVSLAIDANKMLTERRSDALKRSF